MKLSLAYEQCTKYPYTDGFSCCYHGGIHNRVHFEYGTFKKRVMFNSFQDGRRWKLEKVLSTADIPMGSCQRAQGLSAISFFKSVPNEPLVFSVYTSKGK